MKFNTIALAALFSFSCHCLAHGSHSTKKHKQAHRNIASVSNYVSCQIKKQSGDNAPVTENIRVALNYACQDSTNCPGNIERYEGEAARSDLIPSYKLKLKQTLSNSGSELEIKVFRSDRLITSSQTQYMNEREEYLSHNIPQVSFISADNKKFDVSCGVPDEEY